MTLTCGHCQTPRLTAPLCRLYGVHANVVSRYSARQTASSRLAARGDAGGEPPDMFCVHTTRRGWTIRQTRIQCRHSSPFELHVTFEERNAWHVRRPDGKTG